MKIVVNITSDDCWNFTKYNLSHNSKYKFKFYMNIIAVVFLVALILYLDNQSILELILQVILAIPFSYYLMIFLMKWQNKNYAKRNEGIIGEHTIVISEEGLREITKVNNSLYLWCGIAKIKQDNSYIYIYIEEFMAHIIPKKSFRSEEDENLFFNSLIKYWENGIENI